jgi:hypothetical protein
MVQSAQSNKSRQRSSSLIYFNYRILAQRLQCVQWERMCMVALFVPPPDPANAVAGTDQAARQWRRAGTDNGVHFTGACAGNVDAVFFANGISTVKRSVT